MGWSIACGRAEVGTEFRCFFFFVSLRWGAFALEGGDRKSPPRSSSVVSIVLGGFALIVDALLFFPWVREVVPVCDRWLVSFLLEIVFGGCGRVNFGCFEGQSVSPMRFCSEFDGFGDLGW